MATLKDISRHLGLSVTQVSRALNGHLDVNEDTRLRVMDAAKALNYHPNLSARKLATGRSGIVGLVMPTQRRMEGDSLFVQMVAGLSARFSKNDIRFILHIAEETDNLVAVHQRLVDSGSLDGFVVVEPLDHDPRIAYLKKRGIPFVLHGRTAETPDFPYFDIDNFGVGYRLTRHLIDHGHRKIAFLNGEKGRSYVTARQMGYAQALTESAIPIEARLHCNGPMAHSFGLVQTISIMQTANPPTAFIAGNAWIAKGIYAGLQALGLRIPQDVSVVGHDDLLPQAETGFMSPPLTVTESALHLSWTPLADLLLGALAGQEIETLQKIGEVIFQDRASVGPALA